MVAMAEVVRITDRFCDRKNPESIDKQGKLGQVVILVMIFYVLMGIAFVKFQELEKKHPRIIHDVDVSFEFTAPPPDPTFTVADLPKPISLTAGETATPGSEAAAKPSQADEVSLATIKAEQISSNPNLQAKPEAANKVTEAAPVMVTSTNDIKAKVPAAKPIPKTAPNESPTNIAAVENHQQTAGNAQAGGTPDANEGGVGTGGQGNGGTGVGAGDPGAGKDFGLAGGQIATKLDTPERAMGNIAPYRRSMLLKIAQNWHPKRKSESIIVLITLDHDGKLLDDVIFQSSGRKKSDNEALEAIEATQFEPLPDWYKGDKLEFRISMDKVEQLQSN